MSIGLGIPEGPPPTLAPRRKTRQLFVGDVGVGSDHPISVQSMTTTKTHDVNATLQQIAQLATAGCDMVRVACPKTVDAEALPAIAKKSPIPVIADIHFQPKYIFSAIDAGCAAVRVNPGNIKEFDGRVKEVAKAAGDAGIPIRIGVNGGSLDKRLLEKYGKATPEALVESAIWEAGLFEEHGYGDIAISVKHSDPVLMVEAYRQLAAKTDYHCTLVLLKLALSSWAPLSLLLLSAHCSPMALVTPFVCPCLPTQWRKSRLVTRFYSPLICVRASWRLFLAHLVAVLRLTCTSWLKKLPRVLTAWSSHCALQ